MTLTGQKTIVAQFALIGGISVILAASMLTGRDCRAQAAESDAERAIAIISKAVQAHGGAEKLGQFQAVSARWSGKHKVENVFYWDAVRTVKYQMPDKIRLDYVVENPNGASFTFARVVNGKQGWQGSTRGTRELKEADVAHITDEMFAHSLASLVPLRDVARLKDGEFKFSVFGNALVDGKDAVGVVLSREGRPQVNLFFDKATGLVIKSERRTKDPMTNEEYTAESIYRDHKAFEGVMWPTLRIDRRDGRDLEENSGRFELSDFQALEKLDESALAKP